MSLAAFRVVDTTNQSINQIFFTLVNISERDLWVKFMHCSDNPGLDRMAPTAVYNALLLFSLCPYIGALYQLAVVGMGLFSCTSSLGRMPMKVPLTIRAMHVDPSPPSVVHTCHAQWCFALVTYWLSFCLLILSARCRTLRIHGWTKVKSNIGTKSWLSVHWPSLSVE